MVELLLISSSLKTMEDKHCKLTGASVSGIPSTAATNIQTTSPILEEIMYLINCFVLLYIALPSATACSETNRLRSCIGKFLFNSRGMEENKERDRKLD